MGLVIMSFEKFKLASDLPLVLIGRRELLGRLFFSNPGQVIWEILA